MALDEEDLKQIAKLVNDQLTARTAKSETKTAEAMKAILEETLTAREKAALAKAEQEKSEAEKAKLPEIDKERLTLRDRVTAMEAELKAEKAEKEKLRTEAAQERENTAFHSAWTGAKLVPKLGADHLKGLRADGRIVQGKDGTIRVRDPKKADFEEQPTLGEYIESLAKSDEGAFYRPSSGAHGGGASNGAGRTSSLGKDGKPAYIPNAVGMLLSGQKPE